MTRAIGWTLAFTLGLAGWVWAVAVLGWGVALAIAAAGAIAWLAFCALVVTGHADGGPERR